MSSIFSKIIRGEIPADKVFENDTVVAFKDIHPVAPVHILIVPKKEIPNLQAVQAEDLPLIQDILVAAQQLAQQFQLQEGYRLLTNNGPLAGQTVDHLHFHLIGGQSLGGLIGRPLPKAEPQSDQEPESSLTLSFHTRLRRETTGLIVVDFQERLFPAMDRSCEVLNAIQKLIKGFHILKQPILVTEQYPQGLGPTVYPIREALKEAYTPLIKTSFSCTDDEAFCQRIDQSGLSQWVVVGLEAHICVLQTAKGLLERGADVVVLNDAITSRSVYDFSTAIAEMRDAGIRISSMETVLFELLQRSQTEEFKQISQLVK